MLKAPTLHELAQAGVHFGHRTSRWHPAMEKFIFSAKSGIHVINLESTVSQLTQALEFLKESVSQGKIILFVGTKKQASEIVRNAALDCGMPYVNYRWLGGTLTNFNVIRSSARKLKEEKKLLENAGESNLTKKERAKLAENVMKNEKIFGGLTDLDRKPDVLILIGSHDERNALAEAKSAGLKIIALCDTNTNPDLVDYPIPANDDATKSIELFTTLFAQVIKENKKVETKEGDK